MKNIEIDGKEVAPPPTVSLNKNNIHQAQHALLEEYRTSNDAGNPYAALHSCNGEFFSIMHDGIQKFAKELNGTHVRTVSPTNEIVLMPWRLTEIAGGSLNAEKLQIHLINIIASIKPVKDSAFSKVPKLLESLAKTNQDITVPEGIPPQVFKICSVDQVTKDKIDLTAENWPVNINGDGCSTNNCASRNLSERYGILSPSIRCVVHAADGTIKRMVNSKTMNVDIYLNSCPSFVLS